MKLLSPALLILLFLGTQLTLNAQVRQEVSTDYNRNALTLLLMHSNDRYAPTLIKLMDSVQVQPKYFDNSLSFSSMYVQVNRARIAIDDADKHLVPPSAVETALHTSRVPHQLLELWFDRSADGTFGVATLANRGVYNASDNDLLVASASKRGTAGLQDMGMGLVDNSYIIVIDFPEILTMNEVYARDSVPANARKMNGFMAKMNSYVYKLDFSEAVAANFFENLWVSEGTADKDQRRVRFDQTQFPVVLVNSFSQDITALQFNPGETLAPRIQKTQDQQLATLLETAHNYAMLQLERTSEAFRVRAMIFDVNPIAIKIGRKEGLKFDQRYFVYENREDRRGNVYSKQKGVIRSMSVVNNLGLADGASDPSLFYQIAGGKIDNLGMFAEQRNATGANVYAGYSAGGLSGGTLRLEMLVSPFLYEISGKSGVAKGMTGVKLYLEGGVNVGEYYYSPLLEDTNFMLFRASLGASKEIYFIPNIYVDPFVGVGYEMATPSNDSNARFESYFAEVGARLGLHVTHNIQLVPAVSMAAIIVGTFRESDTIDPVSFTYSDQFPGRGGAGASLGVRVMF